MYYFKVKHSAEKLGALQKLKNNNDVKLKSLKDSLNVDEVKIEINKKKQERYE